MIDDGPGDLGAHRQTQNTFFFLWRGLGDGGVIWKGGGTQCVGFPRRLENLENKNGHGKVKSWNMQNWLKAMEFRDQSWNFNYFVISHGIL